MDLPNVCSLNESELRERRRTVLASVRSGVIDTMPLPEGYRYTFTASADAIAKLADLVHLEHECCRFLAFKIIVRAGDSPIQLEVTGPPEAKTVIADLFGDQTEGGSKRLSTIERT